ncbi:MAG: hypothetical protein HYR71_00845 [Chloroflexi bacterium]|nr:hypothetical protein [Chloroflexota bacterium]
MRAGHTRATPADRASTHSITDAHLHTHCPTHRDRNPDPNDHPNNYSHTLAYRNHHSHAFPGTQPHADLPAASAPRAYVARRSNP